MPIFILSALLSLPALAGGTSIAPDKIVTPLVEIFSAKNKKLSEDKMEVRVSTYSKTGEIVRGRTTLEMSMNDYRKARTQSSAVFRMIPSETSLTSDGQTYQGTAFHIG